MSFLIPAILIGIGVAASGCLEEEEVSEEENAKETPTDTSALQVLRCEDAIAQQNDLTRPVVAFLSQGKRAFFNPVHKTECPPADLVFEEDKREWVTNRLVESYLRSFHDVYPSLYVTRRDAIMEVLSGIRNLEPSTVEYRTGWLQGSFKIDRGEVMTTFLKELRRTDPSTGAYIDLVMAELQKEKVTVSVGEDLKFLSFGGENGREKIHFADLLTVEIQIGDEAPVSVQMTASQFADNRFGYEFPAELDSPLKREEFLKEKTGLDFSDSWKFQAKNTDGVK